LPDVVLTTEAKRNLASLPQPFANAVTDVITSIGFDPEGIGKPLVGRLRGLWSASVGNYRVLYTVEKSTVVVRAIRHRAVAYPRRHRR
jgi:mRNA-degrading endonuclease RelE of RelBE toxin-antitoxin system